jgi:hypothetical protein
VTNVTTGAHATVRVLDRFLFGGVGLDPFVFNQIDTDGHDTVTGTSPSATSSSIAGTSQPVWLIGYGRILNPPHPFIWKTFLSHYFKNYLMLNLIKSFL